MVSKDGKKRAACVFGSCFCTIVTIVSILIFALSFDKLDPNFMGIVYDKNIQKLEAERTYFEGRYLIGLNRVFIKFPTTFQTLRFGNTFSQLEQPTPEPDVRVRSREGLPIILEFSFQYALSRNPHDLARLYQSFGQGYELVYKRIAQHVSRNEASKYFAPAYFTQRDLIADDMGLRMDTALSQWFASVPAFELINMEISQTFADSIEDTEVAKQDVQQALFKQNVELVTADQQLEVAIKLAELLVVEANSTAQQILARTTAEAEALIFRTNKQLEAFQAMRANLTLTTSEELLGHTFIDSLFKTAATNLIVGLPFPNQVSDPVPL